ncbi:hypothetical protein BDP55DRAFT_658028 [Colletotrichum godetiae]|uniref:Secreted protein n=1 Tax=Colletotrichum godetiae TaxID=1209918 RepID=A0AAJ0EUQ8_9PEZI|nr:uncharacterized protein BDP55DRAFT_658028 [Colletotrichum godetiae]KAK1687909.1 hypothetical protein BDP55DRAFT_658028 [Colletotrichum godetiae]
MLWIRALALFLRAERSAACRLRGVMAALMGVTSVFTWRSFEGVTAPLACGVAGFGGRPLFFLGVCSSGWGSGSPASAASSSSLSSSAASLSEGTS